MQAKQSLKFNKAGIPRVFVWLSALFEQLKDSDKEYVIECKEYRKKRSLNANSYYWVLINEIANALRISKEELHFRMLKDYGQCAMVSVRSDINISGYLKYYEETGKGTVQDKEFVHYKIYKGSSEMDSKEMSILIDGAVQEAEQLGIETLPPTELRSLIERWGKDEKHNAE